MNEAYFAVDRLTPPTVDMLLELWRKVSEAAPDKKLYALIDAAFDEDGLADHLRDHHDGGAVSLYLGTEFEELSSVSPWLLELPIDGKHELQDSVSQLIALRGSRPMLSFVATTLHINSLRRHFQPFLQVRLEDDLRLFLRFADTRVLDPLFAALTAQQRAAFVPGDMGFWFPRRKDGSVGGLLPDAERSGGAVDGPIALDADQFSTLLDASDPDVVIQSLTATDPLRFEGTPPSAVHAFVAGQVARARKHGIADPTNLEMYCATAWTTGPEFDQQPEFAFAIQQACRVPGELGALLAAVPERAWRLAAESGATLQGRAR